MGAGASKDGEEVEVDDRYVTQSQSGSASGPTSPRPRSERRSVRQSSRMSMSRNPEGQEEAIIAVTRTGFSVPEITVMEGQSVIFVWQEDRLDVVQVIHDGEKLRPVIGGFSGNYNNCNGQYEQQFNLEGEYKFALSGVRCTPLLVNVRRRVDLIAEVTDDGFQPDIIYIDQGHSIKWQWKQCSSPHSVQEVKYEINRACFKKDPDNAGNIKTVSGSYRHQFPRPGLYFFMTEGSELGRRHFCAVQVRETQREFRVEIQDRSYQPMILLIEEGDRVWWSWDKQKCKKHHSVYQIEAPALNQSDDDPYVPVKDGFRWTTPSKQGLMSYEFFKAGVYYFSDQNFQEAAEYIGTIIVKPKQKEQFVELTESGFNPDLVYAQTGDRIWWTWNGPACVNSKKPQLFALMETDTCLNPTSRKSSAKEGEEVYQYLDDESLALVTKVGLATTNFTTIGVYHYRVAESPDSLNTCSVIVNPGPKNHTIHLTDNGFEPKVITVRPNDRVWWVWQSGKKQHNILQVSHQGVPIENGFCSGSPRDAPSAFVHQFMTPGVFYFLSHSLPKLFGAIVVSTQPQVHEVNVGVDIKPDPVTVKINDIVCWIFRSLRQYNVSRVESIDQIAGNEIEHITVPPRRCMSKAITRSSVQHFYSRSFTKGKKEKENFIDDIKISSVVSDERYDNAVVRVDKNGFHPAVYYIQKSQSVMWVWKGGEEEAHNIIHVKSPDSDEPLNVIHGAKSFNSGKPVPNNSFLYTFDEDGSYTVASQGAPGFFCTVVVLDVGMRVKDPFLDSSVTGGTIDPGTKVFLSCDTPGARIFYTTDGSPPELHQETVKLYRPENGIVLRRPGLAFVRAMATKEGRLNSHIYTSNRFWVMGDGDDRQSVSSELSAREARQMSQRSSAKTWDWWGCIPAIKACFTNPGTLEVFWDPPEPGHLALIKGYQLFLNGVTYCDMFPPTNNSLRVSGMAGGRTYDIMVEVYSKKPDCQPQKSNKLRMKCPLITSDGGPVISLERNEKSDALAIVWMSIDTPQNPISGYLVFLNDQQCGKRLVPDPDSNRCKVVIGSCEVEKPYKVYVVAIPADSEEVLMSNVLEVVLPLDSTEIRLPPRESRTDEEELYLEYLEVNEGSGYLPAMDNKPRVYSEKRDHSFITESVEHESEHGITPPSPLSPVVAKMEKTPILPKESRPPPVIYDAATGDEVRRRGAPEHSVDVEESRYRDGVVPLRKQSAKLRSKSFDEDESSKQSYSRISSGISSYLAKQRSRSHSPTPRQDVGRDGGISFRGLTHAVRVGTQKVPKLDLREQTKKRALTFKTVCKAIVGFIRQEKLLRLAVGPVKLQEPKRYNLKRLKNYIDKSKAFTDALSKTKEIEIVAPDAKSGTGKGMAGFFTAARNVQQVKKLGAKKGGFVKQTTEEQNKAAAVPQPAATPGLSSLDTPGPSGRPNRDEGYVSNQEYERDRRFPPDFRYYDGVPRDARDRYYRDYPYGRYTPPWEIRYREEYEDFLRRGGDQGYDTIRSRERRAIEDYYRREYETDRNREYYRRKLIEQDQEEREMAYSKVPHGERYKLPPSDYASSRRRSMRSPDAYPRGRSYSPAEDRNLRFQDSSPEDTQRSRRDRGGGGEGGRQGYRGQKDKDIHQFQKSPDDFSRKDRKGRSDRRKSSPGDDTFRERNVETPEEYRWGRGREERQTFPQRHSPRHMQALKYSRGFDRNYRGEYDRPIDPREEEAKMRAIAVYANAMGGVNDDGDQSVMTDDNEKSTQTSSMTPQKPRFKPQLDHDFIPPSLQEKGVSPRAQRRPASDSETESETESSESETESETDDAGMYGQSRSMVVMDAQKPQAPHLAVRKGKKSPRTPRTPKTPKSGREYETPRQRGVAVIRDGREYIEVEEDGTTTSTDREALPAHPQTIQSYDKPRKRRRNMAIIEVQDAVELDAKKNEESMEEERQVAVPAVTKESMKQIDEGQFITSDGDGILPAPSVMVESHGKSGVRVVWELPRQPDPEYHLLLYVVNVVGTRFTGDINSDISFECNIVEKGKQVRGVQHCWNIQDKKKCTVAGLVPGLTYRLYVIANYTLVHGHQPCEIQTTSSVIYYTTVGPPRPPKLRVVSVDLHQALLEWEPPRLHEDLQLKGYQIYVDNKPLGDIRGRETRQMMINNLVPGKTLSVYVVAVTKQANQESDPSRVLHITCPRTPPDITVAQQPTYKQGCVLISWERPKGHTFATNEEDISLYGDEHTSGEDDTSDELQDRTSDDLKRHSADGSKGNENRLVSKSKIQEIAGDVHQNRKEKDENFEFRGKPKKDTKYSSRHKTGHKDDMKAVDSHSKDVRGHGFKKIWTKQYDSSDNAVKKHSEGRKRKRKKVTKDRRLDSSSSNSSRTSSSESSSESETGDSRKDYKNDYREFNGFYESESEKESIAPIGHEHGKGFGRATKAAAKDMKRHGFTQHKAYPVHNYEKPIEIEGKGIKGRGYQQNRKPFDGKTKYYKRRNSKEKRMKHDTSKGSSDYSSSSKSSEYSTENESDYTQEHYKDGHRGISLDRDEDEFYLRQSNIESFDDDIDRKITNHAPKKRKRGTEMGKQSYKTVEYMNGDHKDSIKDGKHGASLNKRQSKGKRRHHVEHIRTHDNDAYEEKRRNGSRHKERHLSHHETDEGYNPQIMKEGSSMDKSRDNIDKVRDSSSEALSDENLSNGSSETSEHRRNVSKRDIVGDEYKKSSERSEDSAKCGEIEANGIPKHVEQIQTHGKGADQGKRRSDSSNRKRHDSHHGTDEDHDPQRMKEKSSKDKSHDKVRGSSSEGLSDEKLSSGSIESPEHRGSDVKRDIMAGDYKKSSKRSEDSINYGKREAEGIPRHHSEQIRTYGKHTDQVKRRSGSRDKERHDPHHERDMLHVSQRKKKRNFKGKTYDSTSKARDSSSEGLSDENLSSGSRERSEYRKSDLKRGKRGGDKSSERSADSLKYEEHGVEMNDTPERNINRKAKGRPKHQDEQIRMHNKSADQRNKRSDFRDQERHDSHHKRDGAHGSQIMKERSYKGKTHDKMNKVRDSSAESLSGESSGSSESLAHERRDFRRGKRGDGSKKFSERSKNYVKYGMNVMPEGNVKREAKGIPRNRVEHERGHDNDTYQGKKRRSSRDKERLVSHQERDEDHVAQRVKDRRFKGKTHDSVNKVSDSSSESLSGENSGSSGSSENGRSDFKRNNRVADNKIPSEPSEDFVKYGKHETALNGFPKKYTKRKEKGIPKPNAEQIRNYGKGADERKKRSHSRDMERPVSLHEKDDGHGSQKKTKGKVKGKTHGSEKNVRYSSSEGISHENLSSENSIHRKSDLKRDILGDNNKTPSVWSESFPKGRRKNDIDPASAPATKGSKVVKAKRKKGGDLSNKLKADRKADFQVINGKRKGKSSQDGYFEEVVDTDLKDKNRKLHIRISPEVAYEGAKEIDSKGHVMGRGYERTRDDYDSDTEDKQRKHLKGAKFSVSNTSESNALRGKSDDNDFRAAVSQHARGHGSETFETEHSGLTENVLKHDSVGAEGFNKLERASKVYTTGLHGNRNAIFEVGDDDDFALKVQNKGDRENQLYTKTEPKSSSRGHDGQKGKQRYMHDLVDPIETLAMTNYSDKQIIKDIDTDRKKTDKKDLKGKKSKRNGSFGGNYFKDSSSEKSGSSSSSESESDFSREEIFDDGRKYIIEVEKTSDEEADNLSKHKTVFYDAHKHSYTEGYISKGKHDEQREESKAEDKKKSEEPKIDFNDLVLKHDIDDAKKRQQPKVAFDDHTTKTDPDSLKKIKDFKESNVEDIGNLMQFIKSIETFGPKKSGIEDLTGGQISSLKSNRRQCWNEDGLTGENNERLLTRRDHKPKKNMREKHFLEHVVETESNDSSTKHLTGYNVQLNRAKGFTGKSLQKDKIKDSSVGSQKSIRGKKAKVVGNKQGRSVDKVNFRGSRVNAALKRSLKQGPRGNKSKNLKENSAKESKLDKIDNTAQATGDGVRRKYQQNFRGINAGGFSGEIAGLQRNSDISDIKAKPAGAEEEESIYVDGKWYGEMKSNKLGNRHGYQYILNDLNPEQSYDINVKAISGYKTVDPDAQHVFCLSDGPMSNTVPVMAPAAPRSPKLRLEGLHPEGIDVTWLAPQQHGEAAISGYQMLKNGRLYGSIIPPEVNSLRIRDVSLGEKITLQLIALTEHPVGKVDRRAEQPEKDSGIEGSSPGEKEAEVFIGEKYAGCRPGAKLVVHYTGLVMPPSQVWCENVTGHSALIVWNRDDEPKAHFIRPESYQVTWWPGDRPEEDIQSDSTSEDHLLITNLRPATTYTVVVEARKMEKYKDVDEEAEAVGHETVSAFILTAKSDNLLLKTARPPDAPANLGALATTCSAIKLAWDPPREHGVDVIGIRIDAVSLNTNDPHHVSIDVIPDATTATIECLREKTDYMIRVTAITDEYFDRLPDRHRFKKARTIPKDTVLPADDSPWLPNCSILTKTSGTEPPAALKVAKASTTSLKLVWTPPIVYGSNKLQSVIVRWADVKYNKRKEDDDFVVASHVNLLPTEDTLVIEDLMPGNQYKIIVEAVVSVKTSLEKDDSASGIEKYRRTAHIMSRPLYARTRAPTEPPVLLITGYTQTTAQLYWEKPLLMSVVGKDAEGKPKYLRRYLEGYKLEINGKTYCHLGPASQSCQLTKCKPGKLYHVTLVALTCTEQGKKERKRKYKGAYKNTNPQDLDYGLLLEDEDNLDASPSEPLEITLPKNQDGYIASLDSFFTHTEDRDNKTFGDIKVQWTTQGPENALIKQYNIIWYSHDDRVVQTKYVSPDFNKCTIPVTRLKSCYDIVVEPVYFTETLPQQPQNIQIMIPGPPDPPEIFLKSSSLEEFVIEWGEPRLFGGVRVRGYQVYMNDKKAGNELSSTHRKAVVPCRPNRYYKVNLTALSANPEYHDSGKSNTLSVNTSMMSPRADEALNDLTYVDDHYVPVKVTKVTETSIHLDWSNFLEVDGVGCYKIQWSSVAQPAEREVRLSSKDSNCVINKCLPGTTHFVRLLVLDEDGQIKERSKQMTVQTSAPPDGPALSLRACNFRYIAIQWDKPNTYGDALITGYKVYVNGIVEAIQNADQLSYTFTHGKWCQEYSFQVQALTSFEKMNSKPSEPLVVEWPGTKPPTIYRLPTHTSSNLRVGWEDPYLSEGVKLKHFRVCCIEEDTEKMVSSIGPVHPDTREAEFKQIKKGSYNVYVEVHLYGTSDVVCSDHIKLQPAPAPDPPRIAATVVGFDERRLIEKITCDLVNKRDRLIRQVGHKLKQIGALTHPLRAEKDRDVIEGAHMLTRVEELLEDCFSALENYTGQLIAHVSWQCEQSNPDIQVSGYKVLIDGKQYGNALHEGVKTVRIKLGTEQQLFRLSMVSLTDKPNAASEESNIIDLISETFRCFSFYCYHSIHTKGTCWPDQGCCKYQDSIAYERQLAKKLANQGLLKKHVPPPSCSLLDIFEGDYKPLLQNHNRQYPTVILFWTPWCLPSQKIMTYYTRFARETTKEYNFIAVACGMTSTSAAERKGLIHLITANSWREDGTIAHYTSQCASSIYEATNHIWKNTTAGIKRDPDIETESNMDLTDLLGIAGVPTFLFIHQEGYIAWHGRYSAYDYGSFAGFMRHTFSEVGAVPCPVFKCDCCRNDTSVDDETVETIVQFTNNQSPFKNTTILPSVIRPPSPKQEEDVEKLFVKRKQSPKRKQKNKLTVNQRPYSAHTTTYAYLLKSPYMERLTPSPKTHKVLMRPASSRNVQVAYETL